MAGSGYTAAMNIFKRPIFRGMCAGLLAIGIVGCGNKGPLVLPARPPALEQPAPLPAEPVEPAASAGQEQPAAADADAVDSGAATDSTIEPGR